MPPGEHFALQIPAKINIRKKTTENQKTHQQSKDGDEAGTCKLINGTRAPRGDGGEGEIPRNKPDTHLRHLSNQHYVGLAIDGGAGTTLALLDKSRIKNNQRKCNVIHHRW